MSLISLGPGKHVSSTLCAAILQEYPTDVHCSVLKMIKEVEALGGSAEYARSLTETSVTEIPDSSKWPSTPCSVKSFQAGLLSTCTITASSINLSTRIKALFHLTLDAPDAKLETKPGVDLKGQTCSWFVAPDKEHKNFIICFSAGIGNIIAIVQGPKLNVDPHSGGANLVTWT